MCPTPGPKSGGQSAQIREVSPQNPFSNKSRSTLAASAEFLRFLGFSEIDRKQTRSEAALQAQASSAGCFPAPPGSRPSEGAHAPPRAQESRQPALGDPKTSPQNPWLRAQRFFGAKKAPPGIPGDGLASPGCVPLLVAFLSSLLPLLTFFSSPMSFPLKFPQKGIIFLVSIWGGGGALQLSWDFVPAGMLQAQAAAVPPAGLPPCPPGSCSAKK